MDDGVTPLSLSPPERRSSVSTMALTERPRAIIHERLSVPRLLGIAFLGVILTSLTGGLMVDTALGPGDRSDLLQHLSTRLTMARAGVVIDLLTSVGIVALAALLYTVLHVHGRVAARVALGCWLLEAMFMAVSRIGALALAHLSEAFVDAGSPAQSAYQVMGESLYRAMYAPGYTVHMFFYCIGGLLWYGLFYRSNTVPRLIALWGIVATVVGLAGIVAEIMGATAPTVVFLPLLGFELAIGIWLIARGVRENGQREGA
jgi:hypothetical protein